MNRTIKADQIVRFEPEHIAYARKGEDWFRVATIINGGSVEVLCGMGKTEFAILRAYHLSNGQHEANSGRYDRYDYPDANVANLRRPLNDAPPLTIDEVLGTGVNRRRSL